MRMSNELSVEKAIDVLYTIRAYYASMTAGYPKGKDCIGIGDMMCSEIANSCLMAIKTLESQKWIPVSEPPKETGEYIVTIKWRNHYHYGDYKYSVVKRKYYADVKTWEDSLVIAYMPKPLPEPYKESDKSETN